MAENPKKPDNNSRRPSDTDTAALTRRIGDVAGLEHLIDRIQVRDSMPAPPNPNRDKDTKK